MVMVGPCSAKVLTASQPPMATATSGISQTSENRPRRTDDRLAAAALRAVIVRRRPGRDGCWTALRSPDMRSLLQDIPDQPGIE